VKCLALLWAEISKADFGRKSGSRLAVEVGDGARHWMAFEGYLSVIEEIKSPCGGRGFWD
jgi:hypothetical protein